MGLWENANPKNLAALLQEEIAREVGRLVDIVPGKAEKKDWLGVPQGQLARSARQKESGATATVRRNRKELHR